MSARMSPDHVSSGIETFLERAIHDLHSATRGIAASTEIFKESAAAQSDSHAAAAFQNLTDSVAKMNLILAGMSSYAVALQHSRYLREQVPTELLLRSVIRNMDHLIRSSSAKITLGTLPDITGDNARITELFRILIENAIHYRGDAIPEINITSERKEQAVLFSIQDNGIGIDEKYGDQIFRPFYRLHGSELPGVGLGLAIAQRIVEGHQGRIWVESGAGNGSIFYLDLPAPDADHTRLPA